MSFIAGSFAATCLAIGVISGPILEKSLPSGQNFIWYTAFFGLILAISRAFIPEYPVPYDPEGYMAEVVQSTHYAPRRWQGKCHTRLVQSEFRSLFKLKVVIFFEEIFSIFLTPFILFFALPACAPNIQSFLREYTQEVEGVGQVCSLATFDFERHGTGGMEFGSLFGSGLAGGLLGGGGEGEGEREGGGGGMGRRKEGMRDGNENGNGNGNANGNANGNGRDGGMGGMGGMGDAPGGSGEGKMERSFLSFCHQYADWEPDEQGKRFRSEYERIYEKAGEQGQAASYVFGADSGKVYNQSSM